MPAWKQGDGEMENPSVDQLEKNVYGEVNGSKGKENTVNEVLGLAPMDAYEKGEEFSLLGSQDSEMLNDSRRKGNDVGRGSV